MSQSTSESPIEVKITYNRTKPLPRNLFLYLRHVPLDATVRIEYNGQVIPVENRNGSTDTRFWVEPDRVIQVLVLRKETVIAASKYLVHEDRLFEEATLSHSLHLYKLTYMAGR